MIIRTATAADAQGLAEIYNHAVENTVAILNETLVDAGNRAAWVAQRQGDGFPVLVAEEDGRVIGYASYGPWRPFHGFRETVEHSVYVRDGQRGKGLGRQLMQALIDQAKSDGLHMMVAAVTAGNDASIRLHEALGFEVTARMPQVGQKFGDWLELIFLQLRLDDRPSP
ncbi:N-acyltransferase YncA [Thalassovita autumnalis]|uniref:N-acyltransferase YncA n=1 Tax=Thalassovita autumnalis TaxID=2072972 RepID=A0A0N7LV66_9RHOB|nr:GNAT family N-acetyltransferase [Thalassovita autumnalis]CUH65442.1 N-acyltransferase YncA [Thalassovita autumnalis]CUH70514.1 N-acyltransferase YncA [Thalassovita autumnalis]